MERTELMATVHETPDTTRRAVAVPATTPTTRRLLRGEVAVHGALLLIVLVATLLGFQGPMQVSVPASTDDDSPMLVNFHATETIDGMPFRWTRSNSSICLPYMGQASRSTVRLSLLGEGAHALGVTSVQLLANDRPLLTVPITPAVQHYDLLLTGAHAAPGDELCLTIVSETNSPPGDRRGVGVPFHQLVYTRTLDVTTVQPAWWLVLQTLVLAVLGFWLLRLLGVPRWWALLPVGILAVILGPGVALGWVDTGLENYLTVQPLIVLTGLLALLVLGAQHLQRNPPAAFAGLPPLLIRDLAAMLAWSTILVVSLRVTQFVFSHSKAWPLKAGIWYGWTPLIIFGIALFVVWGWLLLRLLREHKPYHASALLVLYFGAVVLPVTLKVLVRGWEQVYYTFSQNPTDYIIDVPRIGSDPLGFLAQYVALSPILSGHNSNHPPGSVLLLWGVEHTLGAGAVPASWVAILLSGLSVGAAYWCGWRVGGWRIALIAGAIYAVMPGHMAYSVTSMDGVFNALNALAAVAFLLALERDAKPWEAIFAGGLLAVGVFFTYATTQLFYFGVVVCLLALVRHGDWRHMLRQGALASGVLVAAHAVVYLVSDFNIIEAVIQAKANNARPYTTGINDDTPDVIWLPSIDHYTRYLALNIVPFLWYLAPWGLAALTPVMVAALRNWRSATMRDTLALALLGMIAGMWLSGMFIREVERLWGFTYPMLAVLIAGYAWQGTERERLWRAGLWVSLYFAQSAIMRMMLNLYW